MDNKDMPAMPLVNANGHPYHANSIAWENSPLTSGLTKREHFCLKMGVPKTGDPELDEIINEGNKIKLAGLAMQGLLANSGAVIQSNRQSGFDWCNCDSGKMAGLAVHCADALLAQLDKGDK